MPLSEKFRALGIKELLHFTHMNNVQSIEQKNTLFSSDLLRKNDVFPSFVSDENERKDQSKFVSLVFNDRHPFPKKLRKKGIRLAKYAIDISILDIPEIKILKTLSGIFYSPEQLLSEINKSSFLEFGQYDIFIPNSIDLQKYQCKSL